MEPITKSLFHWIATPPISIAFVFGMRRGMDVYSTP